MDHWAKKGEYLEEDNIRSSWKDFTERDFQQEHEDQIALKIFNRVLETIDKVAAFMYPGGLNMFLGARNDGIKLHKINRGLLAYNIPCLDLREPFSNRFLL